MRIGIDSRPLLETQTSGIPMFARSLIEALAAIDKKNEYFLYAHRKFDYVLPGPNFKKKPGRFARYGTLWMQTELPIAIARDGVDVFWGTQHTVPIFLPRRVKVVLTIHDLVHYVFPDTMKPLNLLVNKLLIPPSVRRAEAVVAISQWTLRDVKKYLNPQKKIMDVVYQGVGSAPRTNKTDAKRRVKEMFGLERPYILTVGTFEPRKNIVGLFRAFSLIADKIPHHLAVVGQRGWKNEMVHQEIRKAKINDRIHLLGYVPDAVLPDLYTAADLFVFPSVYEGFGRPPLEAMACGVPVVSSNVSSIPEVVDDAALLVNPHDPTKISEGILRVLNDDVLRKNLIERGLQRAATFTWERTAREMLRIFESVI